MYQFLTTQIYFNSPAYLYELFNCYLLVYSTRLYSFIFQVLMAATIFWYLTPYILVTFITS
jgi:hypothetical protein